METVLGEEDDTVEPPEELVDESSNTCTPEENVVTMVEGQPIKEEVVEWCDEELEALDVESPSFPDNCQPTMLDHRSRDHIPIDIKDIKIAADVSNFKFAVHRINLRTSQSK